MVFENSKYSDHPLPDFPLVTIIALCYNHERFLAECFESIKQQDYPNLQIIITDDCSKDASVSLIQKWIDANTSLKIEFISHKQNLGLTKTLNQALALARGKYISMIATDDVWEAGKISGQVQIMESLPEKVGVLYSDAYQVDEYSSPLPKRFIESFCEFDKPPEGDIHDLLWAGNFIPAMSTLIRSSVFAKVGNYDESLIYEDWDMWLRISEHYHFVFYDIPCAKYRVFATSMSKTSVDRMTIANELIYIKFLLKQRIPRSFHNKAFNYAVNRAFRNRKHSWIEGKYLLDKVVHIYKSPRLYYGWLLYVSGMSHILYDYPLRLARIFTRRKA